VRGAENAHSDVADTSWGVPGARAGCCRATIQNDAETGGTSQREPDKVVWLDGREECQPSRTRSSPQDRSTVTYPVKLAKDTAGRYAVTTRTAGSARVSSHPHERGRDCIVMRKHAEATAWIADRPALHSWSVNLRRKPRVLSTGTLLYFGLLTLGVAGLPATGGGAVSREQLCHNCK
jgi:hypothetical protein